MKAKRDEKWMKAVATRLEETRKALGLKHVDFAQAAEISSQRWGNYVAAAGKEKVPKGARPLDIEIAVKLCESQKLKLTLDWIYRGDPAGLRYDLVDRLAPLLRPVAGVIQLKKRPL